MGRFHPHTQTSLPQGAKVRVTRDRRLRVQWRSAHEEVNQNMWLCTRGPRETRAFLLPCSSVETRQGRVPGDEKRYTLLSLSTSKFQSNLSGD